MVKKLILSELKDKYFELVNKGKSLINIHKWVKFLTENILNHTIEISENIGTELWEFEYLKILDYLSNNNRTNMFEELYGTINYNSINQEIYNKYINDTYAIVVELHKTYSIYQHAKNIDYKDRYNNNILMMSILSKRIFPLLLDKLIHSGVNINHQNNNGYTALIISILMNKLITANSLINYGAELNLQDNKGNSALIYAIREDIDNKFIKIIINNDNCDLNVQNEYGETALMYSIINNNFVISELLINKGADINMQNNEGQTALMLCIYNNYSSKKKAALELKLAKICDLSIKNNLGENSIIVAQKKLSKSDITVEMIYRNHVSINEKDNEGKNALMLMMIDPYADDPDVFDALLAQSVLDVNIQDNDGKTALMLAIEGGETDYLEDLIIYKDRINLNINKGKKINEYLYDVDIDNDIKEIIRKV